MSGRGGSSSLCSSSWLVKQDKLTPSCTVSGMRATMSLSLSASQCGQENFQYSHANVQQLLWRKEKCDLRASSFQWARSEECEIAEEYITALYTLVEVCAYGNMRRATQKPPNSWDQRLSFRTSCSSTLHLLWRRPTRRSDRMKQFGSSTSG